MRIAKPQSKGSSRRTRSRFASANSWGSLSVGRVRRQTFCVPLSLLPVITTGKEPREAILGVICIAIALLWSSATKAETRVYLLRGWFGVFSTGLDSLAEELRSKGIKATDEKAEPEAGSLGCAHTRKCRQCRPRFATRTNRQAPRWLSIHRTTGSPMHDSGSGSPFRLASHTYSERAQRPASVMRTLALSPR
jgi:hypothetical protein